MPVSVCLPGTGFTEKPTHIQVTLILSLHRSEELILQCRVGGYQECTRLRINVISALGQDHLRDATYCGCQNSPSSCLQYISPCTFPDVSNHLGFLSDSSRLSDPLKLPSEPSGPSECEPPDVPPVLLPISPTLYAYERFRFLAASTIDDQPNVEHTLPPCSSWRRPLHFFLSLGLLNPSVFPFFRITLCEVSIPFATRHYHHTTITWTLPSRYLPSALPRLLHDRHRAFSFTA